MRFIALTTRREPKGHVTVDFEHIIAIEDNRFNTSNEGFAWTNVWLTSGLKLEVMETEQEILDTIWRKGQL